MRRTTMDAGFAACYLVNLLLNWEGGMVAMLLWIASYWFNLSWYPAAAMTVLWLAGVFAFTWLLSWGAAARDNNHPNSSMKNINPYSGNNAKVLPFKKK